MTETADLDTRFDTWITEATGGLGLTSADNLLTVGWLDGWAAAFDRISNWLGVVRGGLNLPTQQALDRARRVTNDACSRGRKNLATDGKVGCDCSRCTRFIASWLARKEFGQPDYPGVEQATRLRAAS